MENLRPKIDYAMLGQAVSEYESRGYIYKECPWTVDERTIKLTIPNPAFAFRLAYGERPDTAALWSDGANFLVGSAEQSFLSLDLPPAAYVGVSPCFRYEVEENILTRYMFMKVELFVTSDDVTLKRVMDDAYEVMSLLGNTSKITVVPTEEGFDFMLGGVEIGSFGERITHDQAWIYGTGLALPRFAAAKALATLV